MISRRDFLKRGAATTAAMYVAARSGLVRRALADPAMEGLSDPALQPKFINFAPNALDPSFMFKGNKGKYRVGVASSVTSTGLIDPATGAALPTPIFGYGQKGIYTWPGKTFEVQSGVPTEVKWENKLVDPAGLPLPHLLTNLDGQSVVDTSLHWAYSLGGYEQNSIAANGVPVVVHLHGGHTDFQYDGNPEFFFSPGYGVRGPQWVEKKFVYQNDQSAGNLWYHDHALGITRLNVYAGMAGFYFVRDGMDTGKPDNSLGLPAFPYELAYAIQDRMFKANGELFYPSFPGDPFYKDFITDEGAELPPEIFPGGGPTALAEFFGDHMVVNGLIWPKVDVEPRHYRLHLLNGTDSRFMALRFRAVPFGDTDFSNAGTPIPFDVIGSDQGLATAAATTDLLLSEPGSRYDVVFDFSDPALDGLRIIMENIGGDEPFGGEIPGPRIFGETDRIMAFDVVLPRDNNVDDAYLAGNVSNSYVPNMNLVDRVRKVALFEGMDEFGRLQPLLGTAEPATDYLGNPINWPETSAYADVGLVGQMEGSIAWHSPTTENPALGSTEIWEVYNATGDAHPVHLHLVHFDVIDRQEFTADVIDQAVVQHNGDHGEGFRLENIELGALVQTPPGYVENAPKDMVTALPDQVTRIKMTFDKPGRYVWHCHILSHEDHEMMRVLHVGPGA